MKNAVSVHMFDGFKQLIHVVLDSLLGKIVWPPLNCFVKILVHYLENKSQPPSRLIVKDFYQLYYVGMRIKLLESFDLS